MILLILNQTERRARPSVAKIDLAHANRTSSTQADGAGGSSGSSGGGGKQRSGGGGGDDGNTNFDPGLSGKTSPLSPSKAIQSPQLSGKLILAMERG